MVHLTLPNFIVLFYGVACAQSTPEVVDVHMSHSQCAILWGNCHELPLVVANYGTNQVSCCGCGS